MCVPMWEEDGVSTLHLSFASFALHPDRCNSLSYQSLIIMIKIIASIIIIIN